jgi:hypothetical protein
MTAATVEEGYFMPLRYIILCYNILYYIVLYNIFHDCRNCRRAIFYICNIVLFGAETWTLRKVDQKYIPGKF